MESYNLGADEVILFEDVITHNDLKSSVQLTLTSEKIVFEKKKGVIKKDVELVDTIYLKDIKIYKNRVQVEQKGLQVNIQTIDKNIKITFNNIFKANKFVAIIVDTVTGTTVKDRNVEKIKDAFNTVDDIIGMDTRGVVKGILENGVVGTLRKGIKKK